MHIYVYIYTCMCIYVYTHFVNIYIYIYILNVYINTHKYIAWTLGKGRKRPCAQKKGMQYAPSRAFEMVVHCRLLVVMPC